MSTLNLGELVLYAREAPEITPAKLNVWFQMGRGKSVMDEKIKGYTLALQKHLLGFETMDFKALEEATKAYKATFAEMEEGRKGFTRFLDAAKDQCIKPEREYNPKTNETYLKAEARALQLREDAEKAANKKNDKAVEEANFKTFVEGEYFDITAEYRNALRQFVHQTYTACLTAKTPPSEVQAAVNTCVAAMQTVQPRKMKTFERNLLTNDDAMPIFKAVPKPNYAGVYTEIIGELKDKFAMYAHDLANPAVAVAQQTNLFEKAVAETTAQAVQDKAAVALVNTATILTAAEPGMKPVTEVTFIEVPAERDWKWEIRIMTAFAANAQICIPKVQSKKSGALTTEQMAKALDAASVKVEGVNYQTVRK